MEPGFFMQLIINLRKLQPHSYMAQSLHKNRLVEFLLAPPDEGLTKIPYAAQMQSRKQCNEGKQRRENVFDCEPRVHNRPV